VSSTTIPLTRLEHGNFRAQAQRALRASIITGELAPGVLYTIGSFAERLGVSATPVREALHDLENIGLVQINRNRGFVVPPLTERDLDEIFRLRVMLELPALDEVAGQLSPSDVADCAELVERCKTAAKTRDLTQFLETDRAFHLRLIEPLGNRRLVTILGQLRDQTRLYGLPQLAAAGQLTASALEHEALLAAAERGDRGAVHEVITTHLRHTRGAWAGHREPE